MKAIKIIGFLILATLGISALLRANPVTESPLQRSDREFTADQFVWDQHSTPYKDLIIKGVNLVAKSDPRCKYIDPGSASVSSKVGDKENPVFYVYCGVDTQRTDMVYFSARQVRSGDLIEVVPHMDVAAASSLCEAHVRKMVGEPIIYRKNAGNGITQHPNGQTQVVTDFELIDKSASQRKFKVDCRLGKSQVLAADIVPLSS